MRGQLGCFAKHQFRKEIEADWPNGLSSLAPASGADVNAATDRRQFRRLIIGVAFALLACTPVFGQASPDFKLQLQWEAPFGVFQTGFQKRPEAWIALLQNWVLCPDGSLYSMVDKQGRIKRISADGKTNPEDVGAVGFPAFFLTCDQKDQLYVASSKNLDVYSLNAQGKLGRFVSAREKFPLQAAVVTPDESLYVLSEDDGSPVIRHLSEDGKVLHKFPAGPQAVPSMQISIFPYTQYYGDSRHRIFDWNEGEQRFVVDVGGFSELQSMDMKGHWKREKNVGSTGYGAPGLVGRDYIFAWQGQYIAEVTFRSEIADVFNVTKLEVLDQAFHTVWSHTVKSQDGHLVGVAADGSLYFLRGIGSPNCKLARYTLAQVSQAAN